jgi:hypothetical protein
MDPQMKFEMLMDSIQKAAAIFALLVGGAWVLMNYLRNRTHRPRLQVELKAKFVKIEERQYIVTFVQVKNPGLSVITFPKRSAPGAGPRGSALLVYPLIKDLDVSKVIRCEWAEEPSAFEILVHHSSIEPGLTIYEEGMIRLPDREEIDAFWLRLRIAAHDQSWSADTIVIPRADQTNNELKTE